MSRSAGQALDAGLSGPWSRSWQSSTIRLSVAVGLRSPSAWWLRASPSPQRLLSCAVCGPFCLESSNSGQSPCVSQISPLSQRGASTWRKPGSRWADLGHPGHPRPPQGLYSVPPVEGLCHVKARVPGGQGSGRGLLRGHGSPAPSTAPVRRMCVCISATVTAAWGEGTRCSWVASRWWDHRCTHGSTRLRELKTPNSPAAAHCALPGCVLDRSRPGAISPC